VTIFIGLLTSEGFLLNKTELFDFYNCDWISREGEFQSFFKIIK